MDDPADFYLRIARQIAVGLEVFILLLMSNALLAPIFAPDQAAPVPDWLRTIWLPVYGMIALLLACNALRLGRVAIAGILSLLVVGWAFASIGWSIAPDLTLRRSIALLFTTVFGLHLAARYSWRELIQLIAGTFFILAIGSYIACLGFPRFGIHADIHPGAWRGLWYEKNQLGGLMSTGTLASACACIMAPDRRRLWGVSTFLCAGLVALSTSTTAALAVVLTVAGLCGLWLLRRGPLVAVMTTWLTVTVGGAIVGVVVLAPEIFFSIVGKDATLTGRTDIWEALLRRVAERPWLGYGFGAFWDNPTGPAAFIRYEIQWNAPNAHNGWLDVLAQLGLVGLGLVALNFIIGALASVARIWRGPESYWCVPFMALFALYSVSESTLMQYNGMSWVLCCTTIAKLLETRRRGEVQQQRPGVSVSPPRFNIPPQARSTSLAGPPVDVLVHPPQLRAGR